MHIYIYALPLFSSTSWLPPFAVFFNIAGELPDLQALPQPCSIKNNADSDNMELNNNDNNNNNKTYKLGLISKRVKPWFVAKAFSFAADFIFVFENVKISFNNCKGKDCRDFSLPWGFYVLPWDRQISVKTTDLTPKPWH